MCTELEVDGKLLVGGFGQLRALIAPVEPVIFPGYEGMDLSDGCLCPVDIRKTARAAGYRCRQRWPMMYRWTRAA